MDLAEAAFDERDWGRVRTVLLEEPKRTESERALEILATASWWLDDLDTAIEAREQLFRLRRERGDRPGAAAVAIRLAWDSTIGRRAAAVAGGWSARAR